MGIHTQQQALAQELIDELHDSKKGCFGMYMGLIKKYGEFKCRQILSEINLDHRLGKIDNKVKIFHYRLKQCN